MAKGKPEEYNPKRRPRRTVTHAEFSTLVRNYNEQRTINDSLQREIAELKQNTKIPPIADWGMNRYESKE